MSANNSSSNLNASLHEEGGEASRKSPRQRQRPSSLQDSLELTPAQNATGAGFGILCNDPLGLCLGATGNFLNHSNNNNNNNNKQMSIDDSINSGVYTSLTKLAFQLQPGSSSADTSAASSAPLITIETEESNLLIKEYDGHAIALKVPAALAGASNSPGNLNNNGSNSGANGASDSNADTAGSGMPSN